MYDLESENPGTPVATYLNGGDHKYKIVFEEKKILDGVFSVSSTKKVKFTQGNLQATYNSPSKSYVWGFAANQYDYVGNVAGNTSIGTSQVDNTVVDLFGWSTLATNYGINTSKNNADYSSDFNDWSGLFEGDGFFTLSNDEWDYLLNTSNATSGARTYTNRYAMAMVNGKNGLLIFPDNYNGATEVAGKGIAKVNTAAEYPTESIPSLTWDVMESDGVVFLPAAGYREDSSVSEIGNFGYYWSSQTNNSNSACALYFKSNKEPIVSYMSRYRGFSVRLVSVATRVSVRSVSLNKANISIGPGLNETLIANVAPTDATNQDVLWSSSDESVATVDATGKVSVPSTAKVGATATITATTMDGRKTATCTVTIPNPCLKIKITSSDIGSLRYIKVVTDKNIDGDSKEKKFEVPYEMWSPAADGTVYSIEIPSQTYAFFQIYLSGDGLFYPQAMASKNPSGLGEIKNDVEIDYEKNAAQLWKSGPYFATTNLGEKNETGNTKKYKWGATAEGGSENKGSYDLDHDTAYKIWGSAWRIPTNEEWQGLSLHGNMSLVNSPSLGFIFTSEQEYIYGSMFFPANATQSTPGIVLGDYWSADLCSDLAYCYFFHSYDGNQDVSQDYKNRTCDLYVRAILR